MRYGFSNKPQGTDPQELIIPVQATDPGFAERIEGSTGCRRYLDAEPVRVDNRVRNSIIALVIHCAAGRGSVFVFRGFSAQAGRQPPRVQRQPGSDEGRRRE